MSDLSENSDSGRKRSARGSRSGADGSNTPHRCRRRRNESVAEMIDRLLVCPVHMTTNNERQKVTSLQAIMFQLSQKAYGGNIRAKRALLQYKEFARRSANRTPRVIFVDSDYTRSLASHGGTDHD